MTSLADLAGPSRVVVVTESHPGRLAAGVRQRVLHLTAELDRLGIAHRLFPALAAPGTPTRVRRAIGTIRSARAIRTVTDPSELIIVVGLGAVHLLVLSSLLARTRRVAFDACDAWTGQCRARLAAGRPALAALSAIGAVVQRILGERLAAVTYVSMADLAEDRRATGNTPVLVVPPVVADALRHLPAVTWPITRFTCAADFRSFHNAAGLAMLICAARQLTEVEDLRIDLYGPYPPADRLPPNVRYLGFADDICNVYQDSSCVVVLNCPGSGVPNKLLEAIASGRPYLVHGGLVRRWTGSPGNAWATFLGPESMCAAMQRVWSENRGDSGSG